MHIRLDWDLADTQYEIICLGSGVKIKMTGAYIVTNLSDAATGIIPLVLCFNKHKNTLFQQVHHHVSLHLSVS